MISCIIIEDEVLAQSILTMMLAEHCPNVAILGCYDNLRTATRAIKALKPDVVFLDIHLRGEVGLDIINYFEEGEIGFNLIFTTAYSEFAVDAFNLCAIDFLLKPIHPERLLRAVEKVDYLLERAQLLALQQISSTEKVEKIILSTLARKIAIPVTEIILLRADNVYTEFFLTNERREFVSKSLKSYEGLLVNPLFFKPHRSFILNLDFVEYYDTLENKIVMPSNVPVSLSRERKKDFEDRYLT